jgi:hypothetical protein
MSLCPELSDVGISQQHLLFHQLRRGPPLDRPQGLLQFMTRFAGQVKGLTGAFVPTMPAGRAQLLAFLVPRADAGRKISHIMLLRGLQSEGAVAHLQLANAICCAA